ncbi:Hypothetical predicted protein [Paramuricea clavata]|uniref:P2X purinoreceptor 7 intracellular domain-containing protein n=1 Tax=Paramuricea clavata TaxID=317549 RepID=A0A7D9H9C2_PARCT|nr:Hypothetical predicted protein [Paramuricea clavata]
MASKESFATNEDKDESFGSKEQVIEPYMFEPNKGVHGEASDDLSEDSGSEEDEFDEEFELANAWRRTTLEWCKCGKCAIMEKTIESFCCHEKALEYDEYDDKLTSAQNQETCLMSMFHNIWKKIGLLEMIN